MEHIEVIEIDPDESLMVSIADVLADTDRRFPFSESKFVQLFSSRGKVFVVARLIAREPVPRDPYADDYDFQVM